MNKTYKVKYAGRIFDVTKKQYDEIRSEQRRHRYLKENEKSVTLLSYDALEFDDSSNMEILADKTVNVEEEVIKKLMIEKLRDGLATLSDDELYIIENLIYEEKTERELAKKLDISQVAVHKQKAKVLEKLKNYLENWKNLVIKLKNVAPY